MKIAIAEIGYVGASKGVLLAQSNEVVVLDIIPEKVAMLNSKISPIEDREISEYLSNKDLNFKATLEKEEAYKNTEFVIVTNPLSDEIEDVECKVYIRDLFGIVQ